MNDDQLSKLAPGVRLYAIVDADRNAIRGAYVERHGEFIVLDVENVGHRTFHNRYVAFDYWHNLKDLP